MHLVVVGFDEIVSNNILLVSKKQSKMVILMDIQ